MLKGGSEAAAEHVAKLLLAELGERPVIARGKLHHPTFLCSARPGEERHPAVEVQVALIFIHQKATWVVI